MSGENITQSLAKLGLRLESGSLSVSGQLIFRPTISLWNTQITNCVFGSYSYSNSFSQLNHAVLGNYCSIGQNVQVGLLKHPIDWLTTSPIFFNAQAFGSFPRSENFVSFPGITTLEHDIWVGANVIIVGGISIGTGAIIAAGSVVTKNVPAYSIVGGNPAKVIRLRFKQNIIEALLACKWWEYDWLTAAQQGLKPPITQIEDFLAWFTGDTKDNLLKLDRIPRKKIWIENGQLKIIQEETIKNVTPPPRKIELFKYYMCYWLLFTTFSNNCIFKIKKTLALVKVKV